MKAIIVWFVITGNGGTEYCEGPMNIIDAQVVMQDVRSPRHLMSRVYAYMVTNDAPEYYLLVGDCH